MNLGIDFFFFLLCVQIGIPRFSAIAEFTIMPIQFHSLAMSGVKSLRWIFFYAFIIIIIKFYLNTNLLSFLKFLLHLSLHLVGSLQVDSKEHLKLRFNPYYYFK